MGGIASNAFVSSSNTPFDLTVYFPRRVRASRAVVWPRREANCGGYANPLSFAHTSPMYS